MDVFVLDFFDLPQMVDGRVGPHYVYFLPVYFLLDNLISSVSLVHLL